MPRPLREQVEGGIYHIVSRGVRKLPIFDDDRDRRLFLDFLELTRQRYEWQILAYCLMTNHFHLLIITPKANLSAGMQYLNSRYAQRYDLRHGFEGHVFERRFYSQLIKTEQHLALAARYIVLNPVRAGLCESPADWIWSSYSASVTAIAQLPRLSCWLIRQFGRDLREARERFADFVRAGPFEAPG